MKPLHSISLDLGLPVRHGPLSKPVTNAERLAAADLVLEYIKTLVEIEKIIFAKPTAESK